MASSLRESSGLHSLASLRQHEAERHQRQVEEARARAEEEQRARRAAEQEQAREAEARLARERMVQGAAETRQSAELAELIRTRALDTERREREAEARRDLEIRLEQAQKSQRAAEISGLLRAGRLRRFGALWCASCLLTWFTVVGLYLGVIRPEQHRSQAQFEGALNAERSARNRADEGAARAESHATTLAQRVHSLEQAPRAEPEQALLTPVTRKPHVRPATEHAASHGPCADDGDPLNPCLKH